MDSKRREYLKETPSEALLKRTFEAFDRNKDGTIDPKEVEKVAQLLGNNPTNSELKQFVRRFDTNKNGKIDQQEFMNKLKADAESTSGGSKNYFQNLIMAFKYFDADQDGYLNREELRRICSELGEEPLQPAEVDAFMAIADQDKNRKIDIAELVDALFQFRSDRNCNNRMRKTGFI